MMMMTLSLMATLPPTILAFQPSKSLPTSSRPQIDVAKPYAIHSPSRSRLLGQKLNTVLDDDDNDNSPNATGRRRTNFRRILSKMKRRTLAFLTPVALAASSALVASPPQVAQAGAPVMAIPKTKAQDPIQNAFDLHNRKMMQEAQAELSAFMSQARTIEREQGPEARDKFEKEYKLAQEAKAKEFQEGLVKLKYELLDQGIDPNLDVEGRRQIIFHERGVDLGAVAGTPFHLEKQYEQKSPEKSFAYKKKANREIIKYMVQDLKNRGLDPLQYFTQHQDRTEQILGLSYAKASALATQYQANMEQYGQISPPKEGEKSAKELMAEKGLNKASSKAGKEETKRLKAEAKAKAAAERAETKAKAKAEKERLQEEKKATKEATAAAASAAAAAAVAATPGSLGGLDVSPPGSSGSDASGASGFSSSSAEPTLNGDDNDNDNSGARAVAISETESPSSDALGGLKIVPVATVLMSVGGGAYVLKMVRDRNAEAEAERQRQFKLLMGNMEKDTQGTSGEKTMSDLMFDYENESERDDEPSQSVLEPIQPLKPKKKKGGLKSVFGRRKNNRETELAVLLGPDAKAPDFASTLAKILTFGAPGRFPEVMVLPGGMPLEAFDFDTAATILFEAQETARLTKEEAAEVMANVVNCMLIDIVDLASTSLKEKDNNVTIDAIGIVVTFMNHAADLFDAIAEGLTIDPPVTYGGDVSKGKLEQMYSAYASSGLTNFASMDEEFERKCDLLRGVFRINEKKAEGLMMKAVQKNLMEMMKSGEVPEGTEEMMAGMEGMGLPGMDGYGALDHEQTKEMLMQMRTMKEAGQIPDDQLEEVKKQFEQMFGTKIDDMMSGTNAEELSEQEKELMEIMKGILD